jgi:hypothetical protein
MEAAMSAAASLLMGQFLDWIASGKRTHADVLDRWQSSCPRLSIWEDAMIGGYVRFAGDADRTVVLTPRGHAMLEAQAPVGNRLAAD